MQYLFPIFFSVVLKMHSIVIVRPTLIIQDLCLRGNLSKEVRNLLCCFKLFLEAYTALNFSNIHVTSATNLFLSEENTEAKRPTEPFESLLYPFSLFYPELLAQQKRTIPPSQTTQQTRIPKHTYSFLGNLNPFQLFLIHF